MGLLRQRTLGNSSTKVRNQINEQHSELYMKRVLRFLQAREPFHVQAQSGLLTITSPDEKIPSMLPVPQVPWFLAVYVRDVMSRLDEVKANITSTFGSILKMDSTKKVSVYTVVLSTVYAVVQFYPWFNFIFPCFFLLFYHRKKQRKNEPQHKSELKLSTLSFQILQVTRKLEGKAAGTASWATNVGNEYGQVLMSVLTDSEGDGLGDMAEGLTRRYSTFQVPPPKVLYVDRDCCSTKLVSFQGLG